jgi:hypothetical protein
MGRVDAEFDRLACRFGHEKCAEQPVEKGQDIAEIAIMMLGCDRMMQLMMRGAEDPATPARAEGDPEMCMLEMSDQHCADHR